jgi:hypothetical protein
MGGVIRLSGIDEKPAIKVPICPICGEIPNYWILDGSEISTHYIGWLLSDRYIKNKRNLVSNHILISNNSRIPDFASLLQEMKAVRCSRNSQHNFSEGVHTFRDIRAVLKYYNTKEGFIFH